MTDLLPALLEQLAPYVAVGVAVGLLVWLATVGEWLPRARAAVHWRIQYGRIDTVRQGWTVVGLYCLLHPVHAPRLGRKIAVALRR